jgi:hypothetical protein
VHTRHEAISIFHRKQIDKEKEKKSNSISSSHACIHDASIQVVIVRNKNRGKEKGLDDCHWDR